MPIENIQAVRNSGSGDRYLDMDLSEGKNATPPPPNPLDTEQSHTRHRKLLEWYNQEREKQAANRYQMAIDADYYDNLQWSEEDIQELIDRAQSPLVFNEIAPTVDWVIGTEKRTRVDFKVLPRTENDVKTADAKTKVLKWNSDVNKTAFSRSLAFADTVKVGLGWIEDGCTGDPTEAPLYSRYESWRNMLHDSSGVERNGSDWRYVFRIKWVDLDVAIAMFPGRRSQLEGAAVAANQFGSEEDEDFWYLGQHYQSRDSMGQVVGRRTFVSDSALVFNRRARVKLIECWYRMPEQCYVCQGDIYHGQRFDAANPTMKQAVENGAVSLVHKITMRVRCAVMTERDLIQDMRSPYKHNRFPFTPIWCYKRGRDGMPYGIPRRVRDPQDDLNKRGSKALFLISTNRVFADEDAVDDHDEAREEIARPDAYIIKKRGAEFRVENNVQLAQEHLHLMERDAVLIRQVGGVTDDNLGRATNAISGEAIKARQLQGSVVTAEIFDNLRFAIQHQGEMQLSLAEQYVTQPQVIRLTEARGKIDWVKINQPEADGAGNVRFLNDITASAADFVVDEQDFSQSVRQAMFQSMVDLVGKISAVNPEAGLRILKMALEFSDLPNKDDMAAEIGKLLGLDDGRDPADMSPAQLQERQAKQAAQQQASAMQQQKMMLDMNEQGANVEKALADAEKSRAQASKALAEAVALQQQTQNDIAGLVDEFKQVREAVMKTVGHTQ